MIAGTLLAAIGDMQDEFYKIHDALSRPGISFAEARELLGNAILLGERLLVQAEMAYMENCSSRIREEIQDISQILDIMRLLLGAQDDHN